MRHSGSCIVTQPMKLMTCGLLPWPISFMVSISCRKSVLSLPVAESGEGAGQWKCISLTTLYHNKIIALFNGICAIVWNDITIQNYQYSLYYVTGADGYIAGVSHSCYSVKAISRSLPTFEHLDGDNDTHGVLHPSRIREGSTHHPPVHLTKTTLSKLWVCLNILYRNLPVISHRICNGGRNLNVIMPKITNKIIVAKKWSW